jgi:carboxyl-terminal processing protease
LVEEQLAANRYVGVGISLRSDGGRNIIQSVIPEGPCDRAGIPPGSTILEVDGWEASENLAEVVQHLRGPEGSELTLTIQRPLSDTPEVFHLTRGVVPFKHVHASEVGPPERRIAVLHISRLTPSVPHELRAYAARAKDLAGIIIDLSTTHHGSIHDAVMTADALLDVGDTSSAISVKGTQNFQFQPDAVFRDLPMQVIVSRHTQGTVEWLAAALIESRRATLYGEPSAGAAVARGSFTLPSGRYVVNLATTVLIPKSGNRLMAAFDGRSVQPEVSRDVRKRPGSEETDLSHGRLVPAENATKLLPAAALEPVFDVPNESRRKFIQDAVDHFLEKLAKTTTVDPRQ